MLSQANWNLVIPLQIILLNVVIFFVLPAGCKEEEFTWTNYLRMTKAQVASKELFASPGRVTAAI